MVCDMENKKEVIYCIGDSHVSFFSGSDKIQPLWPLNSTDELTFFKTFRLGAVLADSLSRYGSAMKGRELLFILLDRKIPVLQLRPIPPGSRVLFCFGEIDCRFHIVKQAEMKSSSIESVASEVADRYSQVLKEVQDVGYEILVWNVIPPTNPTVQNPEFPHYGDYAQRIIATEHFNKRLKSNAERNGFIFIDVYDKLIDENRNANLEFYMDQVHLSQKAMPFAIDELKQVFPDVFGGTVDNRKRKTFLEKVLGNL